MKHRNTNGHSFVIEGGIAIPKPMRFGTYHKTLAQMKAGDSVKATKSEARVFLSAAKALRLTVTTRKINGGSYRVWLIKRSPKTHKCREMNFMPEGMVPKI